MNYQQTLWKEIPEVVNEKILKKNISNFFFHQKLFVYNFLYKLRIICKMIDKARPKIEP